MGLSIMIPLILILQVRLIFALHFASNEILTLISFTVCSKFIVPAPISVTATSDLTLPILNIISAVTLTCIIELSPAVDVSVNVCTTWNGPNGFMEIRTAWMGTTTTYTSVAEVSPFGRNHSGNYTCVATVSSTLNSPFIMDNPQSSTSKVEVTYGKRYTFSSAFVLKISFAGVYLFLGDRIVPNEGEILLTDIREGDAGALRCFTDRINCCRDEDTEHNVGALGQWSFPNGTHVSTIDQSGDIYVSRGLSVVRLNRRNNATTPTGQFCCHIPDASSTNKTTCVNIKITSIILSPGNTVVF